MQPHFSTFRKRLELLRISDEKDRKHELMGNDEKDELNESNIPRTPTLRDNIFTETKGSPRSSPIQTLNYKERYFNYQIQEEDINCPSSERISNHEVLEQKTSPIRHKESMIAQTSAFSCCCCPFQTKTSRKTENYARKMKTKNKWLRLFRRIILANRTIKALKEAKLHSKIKLPIDTIKQISSFYIDDKKMPKCVI